MKEALIWSKVYVHLQFSPENSLEHVKCTYRPVKQYKIVNAITAENQRKIEGNVQPVQLFTQELARHHKALVLESHI